MATLRALRLANVRRPKLTGNICYNNSSNHHQGKRKRVAIQRLFDEIGGRDVSRFRQRVGDGNHLFVMLGQGYRLCSKRVYEGRWLRPTLAESCPTDALIPTDFYAGDLLMK